MVILNNRHIFFLPEDQAEFLEALEIIMFGKTANKDKKLEELERATIIRADETYYDEISQYN